jgi:uncharacterized protein
MRFFYSLYHAMRCRRCLAVVSTAQTICNIDIYFLKNQGIKIIVLDFDGVLAAHGETFPHLEAEQWLRNCITTFGKEQVFILSNNPFQARQDYFEKLGIKFIASVKKKPYPDGLNTIIQQVSCHAKELVLIDDRLLTGILATCLAQTRGILITKPYQNLSKRPVKERFFSFLRWIEQRLFL